MRKHSSHPRLGHGGFTLMEILMAAVAAALILGSIYTVFTRGVQLRNSATERTQEVRMRARAVNVIRNDLRNALISGGTLASTLHGTPQGQGSQFRGYLRFTTTTARTADLELHGDIQEVEYYIVSDPAAADRNAGILMRVVYNNLLGAVDTPEFSEELLTGVEAMEVSFFDGGSWGDAWQVTEEDNTVPRAVRVRILPHPTATKHASTAPLDILVPWSTQPLTAITAEESDSDTPGTPPEQ